MGERRKITPISVRRPGQSWPPNVSGIGMADAHGEASCACGTRPTSWPGHPANGTLNPGGIVSNDSRLLHDDDVEAAIGRITERNGCKKKNKEGGCTITIGACGGKNDGSEETFQRMANATGCTVCGNTITQDCATQHTFRFPCPLGKTIPPQQCYTPGASNPPPYNPTSPRQSGHSSIVVELK